MQPLPCWVEPLPKVRFFAVCDLWKLEREHLHIRIPFARAQALNASISGFTGYSIRRTCTNVSMWCRDPCCCTRTCSCNNSWRPNGWWRCHVPSGAGCSLSTHRSRTNTHNSHLHGVCSTVQHQRQETFASKAFEFAVALCSPACITRSCADAKSCLEYQA